MTGTLDGQGAIVTGGARGIGLGIARRLAAEGARVVIWDRDPAGLRRQLRAGAGHARWTSPTCRRWRRPSPRRSPRSARSTSW